MDYVGDEQEYNNWDVLDHSIFKGQVKQGVRYGKCGFAFVGLGFWGHL
jgi:hypothetical protein